MGVTLTIPTIFTAGDKLSGPVGIMAENVRSFGTRVQSVMASNERLFRRLTPVLSEASKQFLSFASTAALVGSGLQLGRFSADSIMEYETAIDSLQAVTNVSNEEIQGFKVEINALAKDAKKSSIDVAKSFETIGSNMSQYLEDPKGLRQIASAGITLSKASREELEPSLNSLTSIMNQFQIKAEQAAKTVNILTAGEIVGSVRTNEISADLQEFGATAFNANVDLAESVALIESLGKQMDKTKIGVGARNLLTVLSAAGGLDKRARMDLVHAGVDIKLLMDKTKSLSIRLHELSKIAKDPIKMVSVFGKENLTAGQVIFNQLGTYDEWVARIRTTNAAQSQANTNTKSLANALDELKASWVNMLTSSDTTTTGLSKMKSAVQFITENLDNIVSTGFNVLKFFALWKGAIVASNLVMGVWNTTLGISTALQGASSLALKGNVTALAAQRVALIFTKNALMGTTVATEAAAASSLSLSAIWAANPIGIVVAGVAALTAGIGYLVYRQKELNEEYERSVDMRLADSVSKHRTQVDALAQSYLKLGDNMHDATFKSLKFERNAINQEMFKVTSEIRQKDNALWAMETGLMDDSNRSEVEDERLRLLSRKTDLMADRGDNTSLIQSNLQSGNISLKEALEASQFGDLVKKGSPFQNISGKDFAMMNETKGVSDPNADMNKRFVAAAQNIDFEKLFQQMQLKNDPEYNPAIIKILNESGNMVEVSTGRTKTSSVMPSTTSTQKLEPKK